MKIRNGLFWTILVLLLALAVCAASAEPDNTTINVTDYGAVADDGEDDAAAINAALAAAANGGMTVVIPAGEWDIDSRLYIPSNTELKAEKGAVIHSSINDGPMVIETGSEQAGGYSRAENITVTGGTWIANGSSSGEAQIFAFHHCKNITIQNLTCKSMTGHAVNLSGVDHATVSGVTMTNQKPNPKQSNETTECVHLDYCTEEGEPYFGKPYDGTPSKDITVTGCKFDNVYTGVGNHREAPAGGKATSDITVKNCTFTKVAYYAVTEWNMRGLKIIGCTVSDTPYTAHMRKVSGLEIRGNTVEGGNQAYAFFDAQEDSALRAHFYLQDCSEITAADNTVRNSRYNAIKIYFADGAAGESVISGNKISNVLGPGLNIRKGKNKVTVSENELSGIGGGGIFIGSIADITVSGNTINNADGDAVTVFIDDTAQGQTVISGNIISSASGMGIIARNGDNRVVSSGVTISDNQLSGITGDGIYIRSLMNASITGNTVDSAGGDALYVFGEKSAKAPTTVVTISGNTLSTSSAKNYDLYLYHNTNSTISGNTLKNFLFYHCKSAVYTADFPLIATITLDHADDTYVYTGGKICPVVTVQDAAGRVLQEGKDYKLQYVRNTSVGDPKTLVKVKGETFGFFEGQVIDKPFTIIPKAAKKPAVQAGKKQLTVTWQYDKKNKYTGYEIQYSLKKNFKNAETIVIKKPRDVKAEKTDITGLKKGKTYYVRIRTYKNNKGKNYYSKWSKTLKVKVK